MKNPQFLILQEGECKLFENFEKAKMHGKGILKEKNQKLIIYTVSEFGEMDESGAMIYNKE